MKTSAGSNFKYGVICTALALTFAAAPNARAQEGKTDQSNDRYAVFWTNLFDHAMYTHLGPTGLWGWVHGNKVYVHRVEQGSPADGLVERNDVIVGAFGTLFPEGEDGRRHLGNAVTRAESTAEGGKLKLIVLQNGEKKNITLELPVLGDYAESWPFDCRKSKRIVDNACAYLAEEQLPNGHFPSDSEIGQPLVGLLLLAGDDPRYLDNARRAAYWIVDNPYTGGLPSWTWGYRCVFLSEYYLATGDRNILPGLQKLVDKIESIQAACGSWGHGVPGGYGTVNSTGLVCYMGLILARQCDIRVDREVVDRSTNMFQRFAGKGQVPYGDHVPYRGKSAGNGKTAQAAIDLKLIGGYPDEVAAFIHTVAESYPYVETGHTGCYFSFFWNSIAVADATPEQARRFWNHWRWYYDLSRHWRGGMVSQPYLGFGEWGLKYQSLGIPATTGGLAMFYALPRKSLRLLGAEESVFAADAPKTFEKGRALYDRHKWKELEAELGGMLNDANLSARETRMADQMLAAAKKTQESVRLTLARAKEIHGPAGNRFSDLYKCWVMVGSLKRLLGDDAPELDEINELIATGETSRWLESGRKYYELLDGMQGLSCENWHHYGRRAKATLGRRDLLTSEVGWTTVLPLSSEEAQRQWRWHMWGDFLAPVEEDASEWPKIAGWSEPGFDDSAWTLSPGPAVRSAKKGVGAVVWGNRNILMRSTFEFDGTHFRKWQLLLGLAGQREHAMIYLNGRKIAAVHRGTSPVDGYAIVPLSDRVAELLRNGTNTIAVYAKSSRGGYLDIGLQGRN